MTTGDPPSFCAGESRCLEHAHTPPSIALVELYSHLEYDAYTKAVFAIDRESVRGTIQRSDRSPSELLSGILLPGDTAACPLFICGVAAVATFMGRLDHARPVRDRAACVQSAGTQRSRAHSRNAAMRSAITTESG